MARVFAVPDLGSAEEDVLLSTWQAAEGQALRQGGVLCTIETLKASFEVEADADLVLLRRLVAEGERVAARGALAIVGTTGEAISPAQIAALLASQAPARATPAQAPGSPAAAAAVPLTPAAPLARRRAAELGIALAAVRGTGPEGMVRVEDVERAGAGRLDPDFVRLLGEDSAAFGALSSELKVHLYRRAGARLGRDVHLGPGTVLRVARLVLGDGCRLAAGCTVDAVELEAGRLWQLGPRCQVRCRSIQLGDNAFFASDVEVGGGGAMDPEAELVIGSHGFVGEHVHLNPCRRLELGDEVVVSRGAVLMTHSFGGSVLEGYPSRIQGLRIGDRCQIGIQAVLFPGVTMGEGSILLSGSSLVTAVPPGRLFGGVPARDLKAAAQALPAAARARGARELIVELGRQLRLRGLTVETAEDERGAAVTVLHEGKLHRVQLCLAGDSAPTPAAEDVRVFLAADDARLAALPPEATAIDLEAPRLRGPGGPLTDALREWLRKHGVRLHPRAWTYPGGWL